MSEDVQKAVITQNETIPLRTERGQPRIVTSSRFIQDKQEIDFQLPRWLCVTDQMYRDDTIYTSVEYTNLHVILALYRGEFKSKSTQRSRTAADFLNYCIRNFSYGNWFDSLINATTDIQYGFSLLNIVIEKKGYGSYANSWTIRKLASRDQKSLFGWLYNDQLTEVLGAIQLPNFKQTLQVADKFQSQVSMASMRSLTQDTNYPILWSEQLMHFRYNPRNDNPQGNTPFKAAYQTWQEKQLVSKYEVIGVSKDLGGALILRVPNDLLEKAANPTLYEQEAKDYTSLQKDAADLHAGESSYIVLSSATDDHGQFLYDVVFKGVDGGGKQYNTSDIIEQKKKSLHNIFGTGFLILGQDSVGSYSLASSKMSTHAHYIERDLTQKSLVINELAKKLLIANNIDLDWKDMPEFVPADPTEFDWDVVSKFIQRAKSVGGLTPQALEYLYTKVNFPIEGIEDLDFVGKGQSRAGESGGTSGTGNSQSSGGNSSLNSENASVQKSFVLEEEDEDYLYIIDTISGQTILVPKS